LAKLARGGKSISYTRYADPARRRRPSWPLAQSATLIDCAFLQGPCGGRRARRGGTDRSGHVTAGQRQEPDAVANAARNVREAIDLLLNVQGAGSFALVNHCNGCGATSTPAPGTAWSPRDEHEFYGRALVGADEQQMHLLT